MKTMILHNGDMVITIPKEERAIQRAHLESLIPADEVEFEEITVLLEIVNQSKTDCQPINKPKFKLIQGGKPWNAP